MAKKRFTAKDLTTGLGLVPDGKGGYRPKTMLEKALEQDNAPDSLFPQKKKPRKGRPVIGETLWTANVQTGENLITIPILIPGLNGSDGLMQEHFSKVIKKKEQYEAMLLSLRLYKHPGKVRITWTRYTHNLMDWDNHGASFKHIGDSLVAVGCIKDDMPEIVVEFIPKQIRVLTKGEVRMELLIQDL
jgi:hypothetical protein